MLVGGARRLKHTCRVKSERGLDAGTIEYQGRRAGESTDLPLAELLAWMKKKYQADLKLSGFMLAGGARRLKHLSGEK